MANRLGSRGPGHTSRLPKPSGGGGGGGTAGQAVGLLLILTKAS